MRELNEMLEHAMRNSKEALANEIFVNDLVEKLIDGLHKISGFAFRVDHESVDSSNGDIAAVAHCCALGINNHALALEATALLYVNIESTEKTHVTATVFLYINKERVAVSDKDFVWFSMKEFKGCQREWTYQGWDSDDYGEYAAYRAFRPPDCQNNGH